MDYSSIHNDAFMRRQINHFLLHSPQTSQIFYEAKNLAQALLAGRELARLATLDDKSQKALPVAIATEMTGLHSFAGPSFGNQLHLQTGDQVALLHQAETLSTTI